MRDGSERDDARPTHTPWGTVIWTDAMLDDLRQAWNAGRNGTEIVQMISESYGVEVSRNAVVGRVHRLRNAGVRMRSATDDALSRKRKRLAKASNADRKPAKAASRRRPATPRPKGLPPEIGPPMRRLPRQPVSLAVVEAVQKVTGCRWPVGELHSPDFHFCNGAWVPGSSYCDHHLLLSSAPRAEVKVQRRISARLGGRVAA
jgi:GcrA cell cycle regulator